ncbi:hypothetical protein [Mycoplasma todarodis]|uniref:hypothetical protein n=1 Tax=Mycoplasma todarodis TaxID=1937191 RepID=UPI003B2CC254
MINNLKSKPKLLISVVVMFFAGLLGIILGSVALTTEDMTGTFTLTDGLKHLDGTPEYFKAHIQAAAAMASLAIILGLAAFALGTVTMLGLIKSETVALIIAGVLLVLVIIFGAIGVQFAKDVFDPIWVAKHAIS